MNKEQQVLTSSAPPPAVASELPISPSRAQLVAAGIVASTVLLLLGSLVYFAPMLARLGLVGHLWYVLLVALGLVAGILVFALNKSWASYSGQALGGKLELGGPVVVMFAMVILGFWLVPAPAASFDVVIFLDSKASESPGRLLPSREWVSLELGADRKREVVDEKGIARFIGVPSNLRADEVVATLESEFRELVDPNKKLKIGDSPLHLAVRVKTIPFAGTIQDKNGQPIGTAQVSVRRTSVPTDAHGHFEMAVRADLPEPDRFVEVIAPGFQSYRGSFTPGSNELQVQLARMAAVTKP